LELFSKEKNNDNGQEKWSSPVEGGLKFNTFGAYTPSDFFFLNHAGILHVLY
jgi:hypothetical protein